MSYTLFQLCVHIFFCSSWNETWREIEGTATLLAQEEVAATFPAYVEKYGERIKGLGTTPESMAVAYSQPIRIVPSRVV